MDITIKHGLAYPLGAVWDGKGVNFAIYSPNATQVELCLFENSGDEKELVCVKMQHSQQIWHIYIADLNPGQLYAYRINGPFEPHKGHRFNPNKLLIDPYAKAIDGLVDWNEVAFGYDYNNPDEGKSFSQINNAVFIPKSVVINPYFDWDSDRRPNTPRHKSIIYELHVKGFTKLHPDIPENIKGTYAAMYHPATIEYLKCLGVTAVELMPVQHFTSNYELIQKKLANYWGYDTIGFFAPHSAYSASGTRGGQVMEFKQMVKELHKAEIEVILDVVYNHTSEGNEMGPTLSFKGIDNISYYRLDEKDKSKYYDVTGTGNTLHAAMPGVLRLIMDSLRYWVTEMHVDGFRFDLATALSREFNSVNKLSPFFSIIYQDPVISQVKIIAEPWDVGEEGYQLGKFPPEWSEWNGKFRDDVRRFWKGEPGMLKELAKRFTGSSDLYADNFRNPTASVNFITAHDGFTLHDLVSYNDKHNEANHSDNKDGATDNYSWNCGVEGPTEDKEVIRLRNLQKRNFLATLLLSQGIPMISHGDEIGRTQNGNNNAYCHDNELSWIRWETADKGLVKFVQQLITLRNNHPVFSRRSWFTGEKIDDKGVKDIAWFQQNGTEMRDTDWDNCRCVGIYLDGRELRMEEDGRKITDNHFFVIFNAQTEQQKYKLPEDIYSFEWKKILDTTGEGDQNDLYKGGMEITVEPRSMLVLMHELE